MSDALSEIKGTNYYSILIWGLVIIVFIIVIHYFYQNIIIGNIDKRVDNGLEVFKNTAYSTNWDDFPTQYFNQYYQKNMPLKVADFYWSASRKSYQPVGESHDIPSYRAIQKVLESGARVINLDIYSQQESVLDNNAIPVVRNKTIMSGQDPLDFKKCLQVILQNAWRKNAEYPLILYLEISIIIIGACFFIISSPPFIARNSEPSMSSLMQRVKSFRS